MSVKPGRVETINELAIHGHGFAYPYHVRYNKGQVEVQANGFDSSFARLQGEDAIQELLNLENSSRQKIFGSRDELMDELRAKLL